MSRARELGEDPVPRLRTTSRRDPRGSIVGALWQGRRAGGEGDGPTVKQVQCGVIQSCSRPRLWQRSSRHGHGHHQGSVRPRQQRRRWPPHTHTRDRLRSIPADCSNDDGPLHGPGSAKMKNGDVKDSNPKRGDILRDKKKLEKNHYQR